MVELEKRRDSLEALLERRDLFLPNTPVSPSTLEKGHPRLRTFLKWSPSLTTGVDWNILLGFIRS